MAFSISFSSNIKPCCLIDFLNSFSFNWSKKMNVSRQRSFPNSTTAFAYDTTIMQLLTGANSSERLRAAWIPSICSLLPPVSTSKITVGGIPLYETALLKASVKSAQRWMFRDKDPFLIRLQHSLMIQRLCSCLQVQILQKDFGLLEFRVSALYYRLSQLQRSRWEEFPCMKQPFLKLQ